MNLRKIIFWSHLCAGVAVGAVVFIMSVTGAMLAYERQIIAWADGYHVTPPSANAQPLPVETLLAKVKTARPNATPSGIILQSNPAAPVAVNFGRGQNLFVDPYTGKILGEGAKAWRHFFDFVTSVHRWLGAGEQNRAIGKSITGACTLTFLFLVVSGFYLWWPRKWDRRALRSSIWFVRGLRGRERKLNRHKTIGFWCAPALFFVVLTGVIMSYSWANNLLYKLTRSKPPQQRGHANFSAAPTEIKTAGLNKILIAAEKKVSGWNRITLRFPKQSGEPLTFLIDRGNGARPDLRATLTVNAGTGEEIRWQPYANESAGQKARSWARFIHTGEAGGLTGQTVALLASVGGAMLVWSGMAMAFRRFFFPR